MLIGKAVFDASSLSDLIEKVEIGTYVVPTTISKEIVSFLNGMLQYNSKNRLSAAQLAQHPFLTKNVRDFQRIDTKKVSKKIGNNGLNINVKQNQTIWSIFNQDDEKILLNIKGTDTNSQLNRANSLNQPPIPLTSYSSGGGSIYSSQMPNNSNISNNNFIPNTSTFNNNMRPNAPSIGTSFYGQSMHANNQNARMQQFQQQQQQQQPALRYAHTFNPNRINNINNNFQGQRNQPNYGGNMGINNNNRGFNNNPQQQYKPMDNDDSGQEKVCLIM
jgi:serine/threonine protein kinase